MECVEVKCGQALYYVDKAYIEGFIAEPEIFAVPGAGEHIEGISFYQDKLVVYYSLKQTKDTDTRGCGVLLQGGPGYLCGITGDVIAQLAMDPDGLQGRYPGIWEIQSDSIK